MIIRRIGESEFIEEMVNKGDDVLRVKHPMAHARWELITVRLVDDQADGMYFVELTRSIDNSVAGMYGTEESPAS